MSSVVFLFVSALLSPTTVSGGGFSNNLLSSFLLEDSFNSTTTSMTSSRFFPADQIVDNNYDGNNNRRVVNDANGTTNDNLLVDEATTRESRGLFGVNRGLSCSSSRGNDDPLLTTTNQHDHNNSNNQATILDGTVVDSVALTSVVPISFLKKLYERLFSYAGVNSLNTRTKLHVYSSLIALTKEFERLHTSPLPSRVVNASTTTTTGCQQQQRRVGIVQLETEI